MESSGIPKKSRLLAIAVAIAALLIAVYSVIGQLSGPEVFAEGDTEIAVTAGEHFSVRLADDPADGGHWVIAEPRPDPAVLQATGGHFDADDPPPSGAGGSRYLDFTAVHPGRTDLRLLRCRRCGTPDADEGARSLNFRVTVG
ncbi:protease inhibitor I42 family protein [Streptomyces celluloflavus]|uniref:protease inhibitor I42 family protein n=1 Tax=Streptomyces celluloflavus TaxID=58344 RepID=UPI0034605638|nr:protease inhibitor I42 family protein [Streptomyces celluloflavus]